MSKGNRTASEVFLDGDHAAKFLRFEFMLLGVEFCQPLHRLLVAKVIGSNPNALYKRGHPCTKANLLERDHRVGQIAFRVEGGCAYINVDHELIESRSD
jgi:hypothetical protein